MGGFSQYNEPETTSNRRPILIALGAVVLVMILVFLFSHYGKPPVISTPVAPAYAANLEVSDLHMSTAENFVGSNVTYVEGKVTNRGDKVVIGADVETIFRNTLGEIVDKQPQPLSVEITVLGSPDWVALNAAPLAPGQVLNFRLTFEHISADWNQGYPEVRFVSLQTK
jgi:hypothetical protein